MLLLVWFFLFYNYYLIYFNFLCRFPELLESSPLFILGIKFWAILFLFVLSYISLLFFVHFFFPLSFSFMSCFTFENSENELAGGAEKHVMMLRNATALALELFHFIPLFCSAFFFFIIFFFKFFYYYCFLIYDNSENELADGAEKLVTMLRNATALALGLFAANTFAHPYKAL